MNVRFVLIAFYLFTFIFYLSNNESISISVDNIDDLILVMKITSYGLWILSTIWLVWSLIDKTGSRIWIFLIYKWIKQVCIDWVKSILAKMTKKISFFENWKKVSANFFIFYALNNVYRYLKSETQEIFSLTEQN